MLEEDRAVAKNNVKEQRKLEQEASQSVESAAARLLREYGFNAHWHP